ncbi:MAG: hypothetical protein JWQ11_3165 [Rhizobacter sp.]|nr:hypothetical protein [Rhizobacter sp.]
MTWHVKYALMTTGQPTDRDFEANTQEEVEAGLAKDLAAGVSIVHGSVTDQDKVVIATLKEDSRKFVAVPGTVGWADRG